MLKRIKNFFHWRQNESGRSMVEMLGVLAVIGVLTLGGLAGYNYAMNKHRANTILSEIMLRYVVAQQQMTLGAPINMSEFEDTILGDYKIDVYKSDDRDNIVEFRVSNVPVDVILQFFSQNSGVWNLPLRGFDLKLQDDVIAQANESRIEMVPSAQAGWLGKLGQFILRFFTGGADTVEGTECFGKEMSEPTKKAINDVEKWGH